MNHFEPASEFAWLDLAAQTIAVFASRATLDLATGAPVGAALANPDNLALDHDDNVYHAPRLGRHPGPCERQSL